MSGSVGVAFTPNATVPLTAQYFPPPPASWTPVDYWLCCYSNGADVGSRTLSEQPPAAGRGFSLPLPPAAGTYTVRAYSAATGGTLLYESASFTVPVSAAVTGTLSGLPTTGTAGAALASGGTYSLTNATSGYIGLWNIGSGAYQGALVAVSGASGSVPSFTPSAAGSYQVRLCSDSAGATVLATSPTITVAAAQVPAETGSFGNLPSGATAGVAVTGITYTASNVSTPYYTTQLGSGAESGRAALSGGTVPSFTPGAAGTLTLRMYDAAGGGNLVTYVSFTVSAAAETGSMSGVPTSGSATVPLTGGTYTLQNGSSAYVGLYNVTTSAYQGSLVAVSGASGNLPSFTPTVADTYAYQLTSDSAGANVLAISPNITVGAAPDVVLTGLPSSIAAGQPLSGTTFVTNNSAYGDFVLWDQTAGAIDGFGADRGHRDAGQHAGLPRAAERRAHLHGAAREHLGQHERDLGERELQRHGRAWCAAGAGERLHHVRRDHDAGHPKLVGCVGRDRLSGAGQGLSGPEVGVAGGHGGERHELHVHGAGGQRVLLPDRDCDQRQRARAG